MHSFIFSQIPGGTIEDSEVLRGVMINKDVVHPKMKRYLTVDSGHCAGVSNKHCLFTLLSLNNNFVVS